MPRTRPQYTVERDNQVKQTLASGPKTRVALAAELNWEPKTVYASLWRLRRDGEVQKRQGKHEWELVAGGNVADESDSTEDVSHSESDDSHEDVVSHAYDEDEVQASF